MPTIITVSGKARHGKDTFCQLLQEELNKLNQRVLKINYADYLKYLATQYCGWNGEKGMKLFKEKGFFLWLAPYKDMINMVKKLHNDGHEILIVTAPPSEYAYTEKATWVNHYLPFIPEENIFMTHKKHKIKGDIIIDDAPHHLENFDEIKICVDRLYNKHVDCDFRSNNADEIYEFITNLS